MTWQFAEQLVTPRRNMPPGIPGTLRRMSRSVQPQGRTPVLDASGQPVGGGGVARDCCRRRSGGHRGACRGLRDRAVCAQRQGSVVRGQSSDLESGLHLHQDHLADRT